MKVFTVACVKTAVSTAGLSYQLSSCAVFFQKFLHFDSRHAAAACSRNRLAVAAILHIAAGEDSVDPGSDIVMSLEISIVVGVELTGEYLGVGIMADAE